MEKQKTKSAANTLGRAIKNLSASYGAAKVAQEAGKYANKSKGNMPAKGGVSKSKRNKTLSKRKTK